MDGYRVLGHDWPTPVINMTTDQIIAALDAITPATVERARAELSIEPVPGPTVGACKSCTTPTICDEGGTCARHDW